ncbi:glycine/betaine ABC transporter ATP-binding protein [Chelonobacter oris]|uniref:Glycine/betaine ABC transporter ATP-binding protein n=1 Tax=Chelonobacter oris TaxID=505317 RepID=A0A0A3ALU8_9PAST|nr:ABC transporter ATP-binding protein [Chelonobacter oris]KGQ70383.1 glycine/betaine ABC transporter ATP-binding protein [Chelonobacter oris]MDH3000923.1 glycine/betaine ABC transporter ATP-binding protein [Chelonobacter oris]
MITLQNVSKYYNGKAAVEQVSLTIECGEFFVLVGESGSGKTTLLKMLNGLIENDQGEIIIMQKNRRDYDKRQLRLNMGYVLQQIALFPNMSVAENIALIPELKGWNKKQIHNRTLALLQRVQLPPDYLQRKPAELSGGEQQRVGILRALIAEPQIILMDEPFSALDPLSRLELQNLIKQIHQALKTTIVFVTHNVDEAIKLGDRIAIMQGGILQQVDAPSMILRRPSNDYVRRFFRTTEPAAERA